MEENKHNQTIEHNEQEHIPPTDTTDQFKSENYSSVAAIEDTDGFHRYDDIYYSKQPDNIIGFRNYNHEIEFQFNNGFELKVTILTAKILRFQYKHPLVPDVEVTYPLLSDLDFQVPDIHFESQAGYYLIATSALNCYIQKEGGLIKIIDSEDGVVLSADAVPFKTNRTIQQGMSKLTLTKKVSGQTHFFGLGDKTGALNLRGRKYQNWTEDSFGYGHHSDNLYRAIPFYFGLEEDKGFGIYLNNSYRSYFDFDSQENQLHTIQADGGTMDYFFFYGPDLTDVARHYTKITGTPELPPLWSLGFHQCRWSYFPDSRVREVAKDFRDQKIPCDAIYLDIDYMDGYRCFTWNEEYFPDPKGLIGELVQDGFQTVVMIDPGIRLDPEYWVYQRGMEQDAFCKRPSGELMIGPVWPSNCVFPDYSNPDVRDWWGELYRELYNVQGVSGFWNDMNEPAIFKVNNKSFPNDVLHFNEGKPTNHKALHNLYGMLMSKATYEGLKQLKPDKRPFLLARATFGGGQRYAALWTGDNFSTWEHLQIANMQCQRLSVSGFSFVGSDIGGFANYPDGELMVRWLQLGIFHPVFRVHSMGAHEDGASSVDEDAVRKAEEANRMDQEPWSFGEPFTTFAREAIELRYKLLPYFYTAFRQNVQDGTPIIRSLSFEDQTDPTCLTRENEFIVGSHLLVSPVIYQGATLQHTYLPKGKWYDFHSNIPYNGEETIEQGIELKDIPMFVRAGAVIPLYPVQQYTGELEIEEVTLKVYHGEASSNLYEDLGDSYDYRKGAYNWRTFETFIEEGAFRINQHKEGAYTKGAKQFRLEINGLPSSPLSCKVDGNDLNIQEEEGRYILTVASDFQAIEIMF